MLLCAWNPPGKNTGVDCYFLLQGIFLTLGLNPIAGGFFTIEPAGKLLLLLLSRFSHVRLCVTP